VFAGIQEKLGVINRGIVYAVFDFVAQNPDELSFNCSDKLVVLRKGDDREKEWWWAQMGPREGYMPRNLVGVSSRLLHVAHSRGGSHTLSVHSVVAFCRAKKCYH